MSGNKVDGYFDADGIQILDTHILMNTENDLVFFYKEDRSFVMGDIDKEYTVKRISGEIPKPKQVRRFYIVGEVYEDDIYIDQSLFDNVQELNLKLLEK